MGVSRISEESSEIVSERVSERVSGRVSKRVSEKVSERVGERVELVDRGLNKSCDSVSRCLMNGGK